jgi:hypothetical protein
MNCEARKLKEAICDLYNNEGCLASLELRKIYQVLPDEKAAKHGLIRIIDESGEDYLYPTDFFFCNRFAQSC